HRTVFLLAHAKPDHRRTHYGARSSRFLVRRTSADLPDRLYSARVVRLPFVLIALRRFYPRSPAQRSRGVLPGCQRHRSDFEHQLSAVAALIWIARFVLF